MDSSRHPEYWVSEYDWQIEAPGKSSCPSEECMLGVVFDDGAYHRFSRVHISLCCESSVPPEVRDEWQLAPPDTPTSLSFTKSTYERPSYESEITKDNAKSLAPYHLIFDISQHSVWHPVFPPDGSYRGELVPDRWQFKLRAPGESQVANSSITILELEKTLSDDTQAVFTSFTCSRRMFHFTRPRRDGQYDSIPDIPTHTGRIVRIIPTLRDCKPIPLPTEVLLEIFGNIPSPYYNDWRTDLVSFALVCRGWTCTLDLLLSDFRSKSWQTSYRRPPEITSFANALTMRPRLGLSITSLSTSYPWRQRFPPGFFFRSGNTLATELDREKRRLHSFQFASAFLTILRAARNVETLSIDSALSFVPLNDVIDVLRGLNRLEEVKVRDSFCVEHITSLVSFWPSLKHLTLGPGSLHKPIVPISLPPCALTDLDVCHSALSDEELVYLLSSSHSSLQRLSFISPTQLTNSGLASALHIVSKSLVELRILREQFDGDPMFVRDGEEYALDAVIVHMACLQVLEIISGVATSLMLQRRADAFEESRRVGQDLPVVSLTLIGPAVLITAGKASWPGWKITKQRVRTCVDGDDSDSESESD